MSLTKADMLSMWQKGFEFGGALQSQHTEEELNEWAEGAYRRLMNEKKKVKAEYEDPMRKRWIEMGCPKEGEKLYEPLFAGFSEQEHDEPLAEAKKAGN